MAELTDSQLQRYARQLIVPQIDLEGQQRLQAARVLIVGAGGLGVPMAQYLAGAGVGFIRIADDDQIELSNLPRQVAYGEADVGRLKVDALSARLRAGNTAVTVDARAERFARLDRAREVRASIQTRRAAGRRERVDRGVREGDVLSRRRAGLDLGRARGRDVLERRHGEACSSEERVRVVFDALAEARAPGWIFRVGHDALVGLDVLDCGGDES